MDPGVELLDRAGSLRSRLGLVVELGPELLERLHDEQAYGVRRSSRAPVSAPELTEQTRGLQRGRGGFPTIVLARALDDGPVECLLVVGGGQKADAPRDPGAARDAGEDGGCRVDTVGQGG